MGHLMTYLIVRDGGVERFVAKTWGNRVDRDLFWGPEHALRFIRAHDRTDDWLDEIDCEGGAVVDLDARVLLLYGGEDVLCDPPLRQVFLELLRTVWAGWSVRWAYEGIVDLAEHVGVDRQAVLSAPFAPAAPLLTDADLVGSIASVAWRDGTVGVFPLEGPTCEMLRHGERILDVLRTFDGAREPLVVTPSYAGGFHVSVPERRLDVWVAAEAPDLVARVAAAWPGWHVVWNLDDFARHAALTGGLLAFESRDEDTLLAEVIATLRDADPHRQRVLSDAVAAFRAAR